MKTTKIRKPDRDQDSKRPVYVTNINKDSAICKLEADSYIYWNRYKDEPAHPGRIPFCSFAEAIEVQDLTNL